MINQQQELLKTHFDGNMQVFRHHIYEYRKGLRELVLHTTHVNFQDSVIEVLENNNLSYFIQSIDGNKINVFFGNNICVEILRQIGKKDLLQYTDEEDFMLGIMLGYDRLQQCKRYLKKKNCH